MQKDVRVREGRGAIPTPMTKVVPEIFAALPPHCMLLGTAAEPLRVHYRLGRLSTSTQARACKEKSEPCSRIGPNLTRGDTVDTPRLKKKAE